MANRATAGKPPTKIGYARVSTKDQTLNLQVDALKKAGCVKVFTECRPALKGRNLGIIRTFGAPAEDGDLTRSIR